VILATGDFTGNPEMRRQYLPPPAVSAKPVNPRSNGDGHRIAAEAGGRLVNMEVILGPNLRFVPPRTTGAIDRLPTSRWSCRLEAAFVRKLPRPALRPFVKSLLVAHVAPSNELFTRGAILVNRRGDRLSDSSSPAAALSSEPSGEGWIVLDKSLARLFSRAPHAISTAPGIAFAYFPDYRRGRPDLIHEATSADKLAAICGFEPASIGRSLKDSGLSAPFVAMGPCFSSLTVTEGGLAVDTRLRVLGSDGTPILGLYAAGSVAQGGMILMGHGHHIGWAHTSGRIAGKQAASTVHDDA
jgi:fumarate reductase flavoprotein subunit